MRPPAEHRRRAHYATGCSQRSGQPVIPLRARLVPATLAKSFWNAIFCLHLPAQRPLAARRESPRPFPRKPNSWLALAAPRGFGHVPRPRRGGSSLRSEHRRRPSNPHASQTVGSLWCRPNKNATRRWRLYFGVPRGIRTPVTAVKGQCPRPLDDGDSRMYDSIDAKFCGGGKRDRTDDLLHAMQALSQLSYTPTGKDAHYSGNSETLPSPGRGAVTKPPWRQDASASLRAPSHP